MTSLSISGSFHSLLSFSRARRSCSVAMTATGNLGSKSNSGSAVGRSDLSEAASAELEGGGEIRRRADAGNEEM